MYGGFNDFVLLLLGFSQIEGRDAIGEGMLFVKDMDRKNFLYNYIDFSSYFPNSNVFDIDEKFLLNLDLMVYTHEWESEYNLFFLKQIANLVESKDINWQFETDEDNSGYSLICGEIRDTLRKKELSIAEVITESYFSQLRNAFAHSDYYFQGDSIKLDNYSEEDDYSRKEISIEEIEERVVKTILFFRFIINYKEVFKEIIGKEHGEIELELPNGNKADLTYREQGNRFVFTDNIKKDK